MKRKTAAQTDGKSRDKVKSGVGADAGTDAGTDAEMNLKGYAAGEPEERAEAKFGAKPEGGSKVKSKAEVKRRLIKIMKVIALVFIGSLVVTLGLWAYLRLTEERISFSERQEGIYYFSADYDADIFERELYTVKERRIFFQDASGLGEYLTEDNVASKSAVGALLIKYFDAVINGDYQSYDGFFTKEYFKRYENPERFTMQMIYDIQVRFYGAESAEEADRKEIYTVSFKIMENNGTYRADVASDAAKPLAFEFEISGERALISAIYYIENK